MHTREIQNNKHFINLVFFYCFCLVFLLLFTLPNWVAVLEVEASDAANFTTEEVSVRLKAGVKAINPRFENPWIVGVGKDIPRKPVLHLCSEVEHESTKSTEDQAKKVLDISTKKKEKIMKSNTRSCLGLRHRKIIIKIIKIIYCLIGASIIASTLLLIGLTALGAIVFRSYAHNEASRVASMIVVAFTAAVGAALGVYGITTAIKNSKVSLHTISIICIILAMTLLVLAVFSIHMSSEDEVLMVQSLHRSFKLATVHRPTNVKQWDDTQNQLECCGIHGPEDYRHSLPSLMPPDVPSSCCVSFDPGLPKLMQQKMKRVCKQQRTYYGVGCRGPVLEALMDASELVYGLCIIVAVLFFVQGPLGILLSKLMKIWWRAIEEPPKPEAVPAV